MEDVKGSRVVDAVGNHTPQFTEMDGPRGCGNGCARHDRLRGLQREGAFK